MNAPLELQVGERIQMRKTHACGGDTWRIVRVGAEIGMRCETCDRKVFLARSEFERRLKQRLDDQPPE